MKNKLKFETGSISVRLSLKYMTFVAFITVLVCTVFTGSLFLYVKKLRSDSLKESSRKVIETISQNGIDELYFTELPYFIDCTVFQKENGEILFATNSLIPVLDFKGEKFKENKVFEYSEKGFYSDSELKISVLKSETVFRGENIVVQCAIDIENDSLSKMARGFPKILFSLIVPILAISFLISYLISKKTVQAFRKLESAFEKEKAFSSNVSHELKTPLSIIEGHASLIKRWGKNNPAQLENSVNVILEESENMSKIIKTLLELSKIEKGMIEIQKERFFVSNLFAKLREEFCSVNENVEFRIKDDDFAEIVTDEKILHQIMTVIISNSIKFYTSSDNFEQFCIINLACTKENNRIHISIQDNGPGFSEETLPFVFERFYKGEKSRTRNGSGAGLGLSIAKTLVSALDGKVTAKNAESGGALLELWLPA